MRVKFIFIFMLLNMMIPGSALSADKIYLKKINGEKASRWDEKISAKFQAVSNQLAMEKGCRSCHENIEVISEVMQQYLLYVSAGKEGFECVVCHEGDPGALTREKAHEGMYPNPSSMWVMSTGKGCAKCHSRKGALTTNMAKILEKRAGGSIGNFTSRVSDPSGATGKNHVYRVQRSLMALETGKANKTLSSNGVIEKNSFPYSNFDMDDPDGLIPDAGSAIYKEWMKKAVDSGLITALENTLHIPTYEEGIKLWKNPASAAFADMYRKQCGRCHVWGEGRNRRGDHRAGGCASCHVLYTNDAIYEGLDKMIPKDRSPHLMFHRITLSIPAQQCSHCHTRGKRIGTSFTGMFEFDYQGTGNAPPWHNDASPQKKLYTKEYLHVRQDVHAERGMDCSDCHSSIDVHGDGNIYPVTFYQVEIGCADCHGTPEFYPWELPVGYGSPVILKGQRGVYRKNGIEYLITTRGNPRTPWIRSGNRAYVTSTYTGVKHEIPMLRSIRKDDRWKTTQGRVAMVDIKAHNDKMECYACHSTWAPQCFGCHIQYSRKKDGTDWVLSALMHDDAGRQGRIKTSGNIKYENRGFLRWESPMLGMNYKGRVTPLVPGCQTVWTFADEDGKILELNKINKTSDGFAAPTLAPIHPHTNSAVARSCESCHADPKTLGLGEGKTRSSYIIEHDRPLFQNLAAGVEADIPLSARKKLQVEQLKDFPYSWDQLITREGRQLQNMPLLEDRPLNNDERNIMEREGLCVACHQHYGTQLWVKVRERLRKIINIEGRALTAVEHDKAVEAALKALGN